ncbi:transposase [Streptomyces sp. NPDC102402]|uniref:IS110 family transposase n=1 Tax=Streptomyces sp. NPDC102402 TaxID=3366169 RepID=UPI003809DDFB
MPELWAGTDAGKAAHHCTVIDTDGTKVLSRRVPNNEPELLELMGDVLALADDSPVIWAVDLNAGGSALLIALLASGCSTSLARTVHHASRGYRGDGKTDAKYAHASAATCADDSATTADSYASSPSPLRSPPVSAPHRDLL